MKKLKPYLTPYKSKIIFSLICLFITATTILSLGYIIKILINDGLKNTNNLNNILILSTFIIAILAIASFFRIYLVNSIAAQIISDLRNKIYHNLIKLPISYFETQKTGDIITKLTSDCEILIQVISSHYPFYIRNILVFLGSLIFIFSINTYLSIIALICIFFAILPIIIFAKIIKKYSSLSQNSLSNITSYLEESLNGIKTLQSYLTFNQNNQKFNQLLDHFLTNNLKQIKSRALLVALVIFLSFSAIIIIFHIASNNLINQKINAGQLSAFIFYFLTAATALSGLSQASGNINQATTALDRLIELKNLNFKENNQSIKDKTIEDKITKIKFKNINFSYEENKPILKNFNLTINPQDKIAITGKSGSGKSTIAQLLLNFYNPNSGQITINNTNILDIKHTNLRSKIAYIPQEIFIFSGTIKENIEYGAKLTEKQILKIINENEIFSFITNLKDGINTNIGQKGTKLSGGQKQRIAILRAIAKNTEILLLDEATSALDETNQKAINKFLLNYCQDKIIINISHQKVSIENYQPIIKL